MKLIPRLTHNFLEIKVDEIETTIFKDDNNEIDATIENLIVVLEDLVKLQGKSISVKITNP